MNSPITSSTSTSTGLLKTKISLRGRGLAATPALVCPFHLMKPELPPNSPLLGSMNLLSHFGMDAVYNKFCAPKKLREELSTFLPHLPGNIDTPAGQDIISLKMLVEKPPITGKEIVPLTSNQLAGFRLNPGSISEHLRLFCPPTSNVIGAQSIDKNDRKKHKRKRKRSMDDFDREDGDERKWKKQKKEEEKEKKRKKKKEKKRRKTSPQLHSAL